MALLDRLIWHIETQLAKPPTLALLSDRCAVSTYHMCRVFQQDTGLSIMAYVRARRLSEAAKVIVAQDKDILSSALDAGYGSHEAFTRAFAAYFGTLPSTVRQTRSLTSLTLMEPFAMNKDMIVDVPAPEIHSPDSFRVVGVSNRYCFDDIAGIPGLWQRLAAEEDRIDSPDPGTTYGVCYDQDEAGHFRYLAGVAARTTPAGLDAVDLPAQRYAVFRHDGHISDLPKTVYTIWNKALPDAGLTPAPAPDFECYGPGFDGRTGRGGLTIWIPIGAEQ